MNKKYIIIALMALFGLWNDSDAMQQQRGVEGLFEAYPYNEPQEQYMEPQPRFQQIYPEVYRPTAPIESQYKTTRKQPEETDIGGYEEPEMSTEERMPEVPALTLKRIASVTIALWNIYKNAKRTTNNRFGDEDWNKINSKIDDLQSVIQESGSNVLKNYFTDYFENTLLKSTELYDLSVFGQALNEILGMVNKTIEDNPNFYNARYIKQVSLNDVPHVLMTEEPSAIFTAQRYITAPVSGAYDWTKGVVGGVVSTGWDWTKWGVGSIGSGLSGIKQWAAPISEQEKMDLQVKLDKQIKPEIKRLKTKLSTTKNLNITEQQTLERLVKLESQYESKIRGWAPWLGAAALGAAAYGARAYLQSK